MAMKQLDEALDDFDRAAELDREASVLTDRAAVKEMMNLSVEALEDYEAACALEPDDVQVLLECAHAYVRAVKDEKARAKFKRALELAPDDLEVLMSYGDCLAGMRRHAEAHELIWRAHELQPDNSIPLLLLSQMQVGLAHYEEAMMNLNAALELKAEPEVRAMVFYYRGRCLIGVNKPDEALVNFSEALKLDPPNRSYLFERGQAYKALGKEAEAEADLKASRWEDEIAALAKRSQKWYTKDGKEREL